MTNDFDPLINEESLSGGADPHKQVEEKIIECDDADWDEEYFQKHCQHAPERKSRLQPWAVYVIRLHNPEQYSQLESTAENRLGRSLRKYEKAAFFRDPVFYIGYTGHPYLRLQKHVDREDSSEFLDLYPPYQLSEISFYGEKKEATQQEKTRAEELDTPHSQFAYSDQLQWSQY